MFPKYADFRTTEQSKGAKTKFMNASPIDRDMDFYDTPEGQAELDADEGQETNIGKKLRLVVPDKDDLPF